LSNHFAPAFYPFNGKNFIGNSTRKTLTKTEQIRPFQPNFMKTPMPNLTAEIIWDRRQKKIVKNLFSAYVKISTSAPTFFISPCPPEKNADCQRYFLTNRHNLNKVLHSFVDSATNIRQNRII